MDGDHPSFQSGPDRPGGDDSMSYGRLCVDALQRAGRWDGVCGLAGVRGDSVPPSGSVSDGLMHDSVHVSILRRLAWASGYLQTRMQLLPARSGDRQARGFWHRWPGEVVLPPRGPVVAPDRASLSFRVDSIVGADPGGRDLSGDGALGREPCPYYIRTVDDDRTILHRPTPSPHQEALISGGHKTRAPRATLYCIRPVVS